MYLTDRPPADRFGPSKLAGARGSRVSVTVLLIGSVSLLTDISSESVAAVLALYLTTVLGLGPLGFGFVDGVYQGVSALVRILGGWAGDRTGRPKRVALAGYGLSAAMKLALIPVAGLAAISAVISLDRIGKGLRTAPRDAMIAAASPPAELGRAFGVHRMLDTVGAVIGPFVAFAILLALPGDFRAVFVVSFAAAILGVALLLLLVPDVRPAGGQRAAPANPSAPRPSSRILRADGFGPVVVATGVLGVLSIGDGFLYLALQHRDGLALKYFPLLYVGTNLAYMALALPLGRIADRVGRVRVFLLGHLALIAAYLCAGGPVGGTAMTLGCLLLLGGYYAATDGQLAALVSGLFDGDQRGTAIATAQTSQALARFTSSLLFGAVWAAAGRTTAILSFALALGATLPLAWRLLRGAETAVR
ncbi:MAG: putative MFS-type transporter [Frankiales bacterium]|nr:putative MFS-type transporter [Frankiales bacterium]